MIFPLFALALLVARRSGGTRLASWAPPVTALVIAAAATGYVYAQRPGSLDSALDGATETNSYHAVFNSIVDGQHDTAGDLADLGLPPEYAELIGTMIWSRPEPHPPYAQYRDRFTMGNLLRYYVTHPVRTAQILDRAATDLLTTRADYQGSFGEDAGFPPVTKEHRVAVFSGLFGLVAPLGLAFLLPLWLVIGWAGMRALRRGRREIGVVVLFVLSIALGQFLAAALGEGIENVKHQVIAAFCSGLAMVLAMASLLPRPRMAAEPEPDDVEPATEPVLETAKR